MDDKKYMMLDNIILLILTIMLLSSLGMALFRNSLSSKICNLRSNK